MVNGNRSEFERFIVAVAGRTPEAMVAELPDAGARDLARRLCEDRRDLARQSAALAHALVHARGELDAHEVEAIAWCLRDLAQRAEFCNDLQVLVDNRLDRAA
ncbi:MAG: hypothetical protein LW860_07485 [Xanthomonadaceae bacterium]|jgi:hypothetical protein|nr:hypothetical protein [Xanthomonadaceae bacterium]